MTIDFGNTQVISYLVKTVSVDQWGLESDFYMLNRKKKRQESNKENKENKDNSFKQLCYKRKQRNELVAKEWNMAH